MNIINNLKIEIVGTNTYYLHLENYQDDSSDDVLIYGYDTLINPPDLVNYKKKLYFNVAMPTEFFSPQSIYADDRFDKIYSICPYSCDWLNSVKKTDKYKCVWYPFNERHTPSHGDKIYDVCYHGGIHGPRHVDMLKIFQSFNYKYMSMTHSINPLTQQCLQYATDTNLTYEQKMQLISECKISVCYNNFDIPGQSAINNLIKNTDWEKNEAFSNVFNTNTAPQLKCRFIEACFSKTLNLVERDNWNVIEKWYKPNEHFIYFENNDELFNKLKDILSNYDKYQDIINEAYNYSLKNYTCKKLIERIRNESKA